MTTFAEAVIAAPDDADFIAYTNERGKWVFIHRRSDGILSTCAELNSIGHVYFCAGVSASKRSLWSHESRQFICGTVEQLNREPEEA